MAKYTTEVRSICESKSGLEESKGFNNIDTILDNSWDKIFTTNCTFFDANYKPVLCKKILKHYYTREIGQETVGLWMLFMNRKLEEIMPYYNQLYESELIEFNPMHNMDLSKTKNITGHETGAEMGTSSGTKSGTSSGSASSTDGGTTRGAGTTSANSSGSSSESGSSERDINENKSRSYDGDLTHKDAYSDTPQGSIYNVDSNAYLTNYRRVSDITDDSEQTVTITSDDSSTSGSTQYSETGGETTSKTTTHGKTNAKTNSGTTSETSSGSTSKQTNLNTTEQYIESVVGNNGSYNFSRLLQDFRDTFLNIDMMVIDEFRGMFMNLW